MYVLLCPPADCLGLWLVSLLLEFSIEPCLMVARLYAAAPLQDVHASKAAANACRLLPNKPKKLNPMLKTQQMLASGYQYGAQR